MKYIAVGNDTFTVVDDEDYLHLKDKVWCLSIIGYIVKAYDKIPPLLLHRILLNDPPGPLVDHKNLNKLDNRRINLRVVSRHENNSNSSRANKFRGAYFDKKTGKWRAQITVKGKTKYAGCSFNTREEAHEAFVKEHIKLTVSYYHEKPEEPPLPTEQEKQDAIALRNYLKTLRPKRQAIDFGKPVTNALGEYFPSIKAACRTYGIPEGTFKDWLKNPSRRGNHLRWVYSTKEIRVPAKTEDQKPT